MESKENQQQQMTMNCWLAIITPHRMETFQTHQPVMTDQDKGVIL